MSAMDNFSLLVFSPIQFHERLMASFKAASKKYNSTNKNLVDVKFASTVEGMLQCGGANLRPDYIAVFVDIKDGNSILRCQQHLRSITADFVVTRLCIVNGSCRSGLLQATKDLISLADQFRIPIINAEVSDDTSCRLVAEKLIRLGAVASGVTHGVPIIIPTPQDIDTKPTSQSRDNLQ